MKNDRLILMIFITPVLWYINNNKVVGISADSKKNVEKLKDGIKIDCITTNRGNQLWLIGRVVTDNDKKAILLKRGGGRSYQIVSEFPFFIARKLWVRDKIIGIWGSDLNGERPKRVLIFSKDAGSSWRRESPKDEYAHGPVYFENDSSVWNIATKDRLQHRTKLCD